VNKVLQAALASLCWHRWTNAAKGSSTVPTMPGVYFVRWGSDVRVDWNTVQIAPGYLQAAPAGMQNLQAKLGFIKTAYARFGLDSSLLYIGKASGAKQGLRDRLDKFHKASTVYSGYPTMNVPGSQQCGHGGGRWIWALDGAPKTVEFAWVEWSNAARFVVTLGAAAPFSLSPCISSVEDLERALIALDSEALPLKGPVCVLPFANLRL